MPKIYRGSTQIKKIYRGSTQIKKVYRGSILIYQASETVSELSSITYSIVPSVAPNIVYPNGSDVYALVDGNTTLQVTWNNDDQYIDFNFTSNAIEPLSITIHSGLDNNAKNGVKIDSIVGYTASGGTNTLWSNIVISSNSSHTFTRNSSDKEFTKIRFNISKNGSTNLTLSEITFNSFLKYY